MAGWFVLGMVGGFGFGWAAGIYFSYVAGRKNLLEKVRKAGGELTITPE